MKLILQTIPLSHVHSTGHAKSLSPVITLLFVQERFAFEMQKVSIIVFDAEKN